MDWTPTWRLARLAALFGLVLLFAGATLTEGAARSREADGTAPAWQDDPRPRIVLGYFARYTSDPSYRAEDIDLSALTHIGHWSLLPWSDGSLVSSYLSPEDPGYRSLENFWNEELIERAHENGVRVILVVGDDREETARHFSWLAGSADARERFVRTVTGIVSASGYNGVELDWEFPAAAERRDGRDDRTNLVTLLRELRAGLDTLSPYRTLSITVPPAPAQGADNWIYPAHGFDTAAFVQWVDWIGIMSYQIHDRRWSDHAGHSAPLFSPGWPPGSPLFADEEVSLESSLAYYRARGVPARKLLAGIPFNGQQYDLARNLNEQTRAPAPGTDLAFSEIASRFLRDSGWSRRWDANARAPYLQRTDGGAGLITYDDEESVLEKCRYVAEAGLGGALLWRLGADGLGWDGAGQPLLSAARACR